MNQWNPFSYPPRQVIKTIYGFLLPGVVALGAAFARAAVDTAHPVTKFDIVAALVAMFVTGGAVFLGKNTPPGDNPPAPDAGSVDVVFIIGLLLMIVGLLGFLHLIGIGVFLSVVIFLIGLALLFVGHRGRGTL